MKKNRQTLLDYLEERRQRGFGLRRLAGVAGKTVESIAVVIEEGEPPSVDIQFTDGQSAFLRLETAVKVAVEWHQNKDGNVAPIPNKKSFESSGEKQKALGQIAHV